MIRGNKRQIILGKQTGIINRKNEITTSLVVPGGKAGDTSLYQLLKRTKGAAKVCVIRSLGGLGDVLMTLPAVAQLKKDFPAVHLTYATDRHSTPTDLYYHLIKNAPFINEIVDHRYINRSDFTHIVDLSSVCIRYENSAFPILNRIDIFSRACGIPRLADPVPFFRLEANEIAFGNRIVEPFKAIGKKTLFLHSASFDTKRSWPANCMNDFINGLSVRRPDIQILLSDFNNVLPKRNSYSNVTVVTNSNIRFLAGVINASNLYIGPDSGPMHLAGALRKQSIVLFGSIPPAARINHYKSHTALTLEPRLSCMPCLYKACGIGFKCMKDITWEQVFIKMKDRI